MRGGGQLTSFLLVVCVKAVEDHFLADFGVSP